MMGEMAAGLAHEINQPLGAIVNFTRGCERRLRARGSADADVMHTLELVSEQAMRAGQIIRRIRDFVRKEEPNLGWIDVNELVRHVAELAGPEGRQHGITLEVNLAPAMPRAFGDGIQIEQVLLNLVRNGFDAMEGLPDGARTVSIRTGASAPAHIEVAVSDTGAGLAPELLDRIFEPFFSTKATGLGLGLAISRSIIEAHGGRLWAEPNAARGSTFRFSLTGEPC
jgi:C4-dicarboxylate-specific signal transduction histidine kinase